MHFIVSLIVLKHKKYVIKAVKNDSSSLEYVPDWLVTREWMWMWYDDYYDEDGAHWDDDENKNKFFDWYKGYQKRRGQKVKIKEELLPIAWHPSRYWDWCVPKDEKQGIKKLWALRYGHFCV